MAKKREPPADAVGFLGEAFVDENNHVVAAAAEAATALGLRELAPAMEAAFARLSVDPVASDETCAGKTALAKALDDLEVGSLEVFEAPALR